MSELDREIILLYAKNDMSASRTAKEMHYHRNTIVYHITTIHWRYGLNPKKFYDLVKLVEMAKEGEDE
jgi:DNA-binding PucR family transcriptional regulator